jgi:hypothetical protein
MTKLVIIIPLDTVNGPTPTKEELEQVERILRETYEHRHNFLAESFYDLIDRLFRCRDYGEYTPANERLFLETEETIVDLMQSPS